MKLITELLSASSPWAYCFIFFGKLAEVALASLRQQLIVKGQRLPGAIIALFEYTFWLCITASALTGFADDPLKIVILVSAFSLGNVVGSFLEERMALGFCTVTGIFMEKEAALNAATRLREQGQALTLIPAEGIQGARRTAILTRACLKNVKMPRRRIFFRRTALKNFEIHKVFRRFSALSCEKSLAAGLSAIYQTSPTVKRRDVDRIKSLLFHADPDAVITVQAIQQVRGATISGLAK